MPERQILEKYADLIVQIGVNVQPGQVVELTASVEQHVFAAIVVEACYRAGAAKVNVNWEYDAKKRLDFLYADKETLGRVLPWEEEKARQMTEDLPCRVFLESEDPDAMAGIDAEKLSDVSKARRKVLKPYRNEIEGRHQWFVAGVPGVKWAKKCFPALSEEDALAALWDAVLKAVRVTADNDPVSAWKAHTAFINEKAAWLNAQGFEALHYESLNGTDFTVWLIPGARWEGAASVNAENGAPFIPNMPTEEIFTTPMAGRCEGRLVATKPLSWNSQLIEDFSITFTDGRAVSCTAARGQELLEKILKMDAASDMLGEVALVPKESPINRSGLLFYETLFDENACCHCALGMGFKEVLPDGNSLTTDEARQRGINDSIIHVDFMIGSEDLSIDGIRQDGSREPIFRNGTWA